MLQTILPYIQIILSILLITAILLQQNEAGLGTAFGGGESTIEYTRRGFEKTLLYISITLAVLFALSAIIALIL